MSTQDSCCTIVPYFKIAEGQLEAFKELAQRFVAKTSDDLNCYY